jgi:hypothetical protein
MTYEENKKIGIKAENYFLSLMNKLGLVASFKNLWYDFEVNNQKVEVKSCNLYIKRKKKRNKKITSLFSSGRFQFTNKESRRLQFNENIWVCFILRHKEEFLLIGFVRARELNLKHNITLSQLGKYKLLSLEAWIKEIN